MTGRTMRYLPLLALLGMSDALDLMFDKILCDTSLPAYALEDDITMECGTGNKRCTFGQDAFISGDLYYQNIEQNGLINNTGYVSSDLHLMTMEYQLFEYLPFNFCGNWIKRAQYNFNTCPQDGKYHFEVPYTLPETYDATTWFATGWEGVSYLKIHVDRDEYSPVLAHCSIHFKTFVTRSEEEGWRTLPSAAQATLVLAGIVAFMLFVVLCLACRPRQKHPTDEDYGSEFKAMPEEPESKKGEKPKEPENIDDKVHRLALKMNYGV